MLFSSEQKLNFLSSFLFFFGEAHFFLPECVQESENLSLWTFEEGQSTL